MATPMAISLDTYEDWSDAAETVVYKLIDEGRVFTADDIHKHVDASSLTPAQKSAWPGALFKRLHQAGVIEKVGYSASMSRSRRGGARFEWRTAA